MADKRITQLEASSGLVATDIVPVVDDPSGSPVTQKATIQQVADALETIYVADGSFAVPGSIALGTDTTGNYVADVSSGTGISVSHTPGEGSTATVNQNIGGLSASSGLVSTDEIVVLDDPAGSPAHEKATIAQVASAVQSIFDAANTYDPYGSASTAQTQAEASSINASVLSSKGSLVVGDGNLGINYDELAVGANGTVLVADSNETVGLKYADKELITVPSEQTGATYTLALTDKSSVVRMNSGSAQTVTIPPNSSVAFPVGSQVIIVAMGAGAVTIAAGAGVTLRSKDANLVIDGQYGMSACVKIASDEWIVTGQLTT